MIRRCQNEVTHLIPLNAPQSSSPAIACPQRVNKAAFYFLAAKTPELFILATSGLFAIIAQFATLVRSSSSQIVTSSVELLGLRNLVLVISMLCKFCQSLCRLTTFACCDLFNDIAYRLVDWWPLGGLGPGSFVLGPTISRTTSILAFSRSAAR